MALDLFANFERSSNDTFFYRPVSADPYTLTIKLSDALVPDENLSSVYYVQSSINGGQFEPFGSTINGEFITAVQFDRTVPSVSSISVAVSSLDTGNELNVFVLSAVFVSEIPTAEFIAYPTDVVYVNGGVSTKLELNGTNYEQTSGVWFYGEGHTEKINLSSNSLSAVWYVGNQLNGITETATTEIEVSASGSTAYALITSTVDLEEEYPISLFVATDEIPTPSLLITYDDVTGEQKYYPFFTSTLFSSVTSKLKETIRVKKYPRPSFATFSSPFPSDSFSLPFDYSNSGFIASLETQAPSGVTLETYKGSMWLLQAETDTQAWETPGTPFLPNIFGYQFNLGYDNDPSDEGGYLSLFKASPTKNTTVSITCSATTDVKIDLAPYDWLNKPYTQVLSSSATANPIPFAKFYIPNYFNIKNQPVPINVIPSTNDIYELQSVTIRSEISSDVLSLTGTQLSGTLTFNEIGIASLSAIAVVKNKNNQAVQQISVLFDNMLEIVENYDDVEEDYYQTSLTPIKLTYKEAPKVSPNEWAIADNINSIIEKLYVTIDDLDDYTKLYEPKNKFYGWLGLNTSATVAGEDPIYVWQDLECPSNEEEIASWATFESPIPCANTSTSWMYHECEEGIRDPSCLGKYCVEWKWKSRKCGKSEIDISWKNSKCVEKYAKRWAFEKCDLDAVALNCNRDTWKIQTIDPNSFPIPYCSSSSRCRIVDVAPTRGDNLVLAYQTEIDLIKSNYYGTLLGRRSIADDLFTFQNIVGISAGKEGRIYVLDATLSKVSVFTIQDNTFKLFTSWGTYGLAGSPQGFNDPSDIHIDDENSIWISDKGNECVKKLTITGRNLMTLTSDYFEDNPPISVCVDSKEQIHCLTQKAVYVFDAEGSFIFQYELPSDITSATKINTNYNREMVYITHSFGVLKYFRTGVIAERIFDEYTCASGQILEGYTSSVQDKFRNLYITVGDKLLKVPDLMDNVESKAALNPNLFWKLSDLLIHKEEYIQPWVYLKSFHRLWDNIELFRNSLFYEAEGCKSYKPPVYQKEDIVIGQNEIVSNAVINRISAQLWANLETMFDYFDPDCSETN